MNIFELREMNRRDFAVAIKKLNKNKMILILEAYGVWVSTSANVDSILNTLLDVVDDVIAPTEKDAKKLENKQKRKNQYALTDDDKEALQLKHNYLNQDIFINLSLAQLNKSVEELQKMLEEDKAIYRKLSLKFHTDTINKTIKYHYKKHWKNFFIDIKDLHDFIQKHIKKYMEDRIKYEEIKQQQKEQEQQQEDFKNQYTEECPF